MFKKGHIIWGENRDGDKSKGYHPIVFLKEVNELFFEGAMLTHSSNWGNIKMEKEYYHLIKSDDRTQYLVKNLLIKKNEWGPFERIGYLTKEGLRFVEESLEGTEPMHWEDFIK